MNIGLFMMPAHLPGSDPFAVAEWNLQVLRWADELGYDEAWIGEHYTVPFEPIPAPDLLIAQALRETERIRLAPGVHLLPYHHPAGLAHRIAYLDHLAQGRFMLGVGAGAIPGDARLFGTLEKNPAMFREAFTIMQRIWAGGDEPFHIQGEFWDVEYKGKDPECELHLKPFQTPHPPIGMAGGSPNSRTLRFAGEQGFFPMSFSLPPAGLRGQWDTYAEGAAEGGHSVDRSSWRVLREFFVAETDEEARKLSLGDAFGHMQSEFLMAVHRRMGQLRSLAPDPDITEEEVTPEYLADRAWLIGSPDTVARKLREQYEESGGWGTVLGLGFDYSHNPEPWRRSMELMVKEVLPQVADLEPLTTAQA